MRLASLNSLFRHGFDYLIITFILQYLDVLCIFISGESDHCIPRIQLMEAEVALYWKTVCRNLQMKAQVSCHNLIAFFFALILDVFVGNIFKKPPARGKGLLLILFLENIFVFLLGMLLVLENIFTHFYNESSQWKVITYIIAWEYILRS